MEIRTKFNVGDKVYVITDFDGIREGTVERIVVSLKVYYDISKVENCEELYEEQDCFATKEEAQKECDKRNGNN